MGAEHRPTPKSENEIRVDNIVIDFLKDPQRLEKLILKRGVFSLRLDTGLVLLNADGLIKRYINPNADPELLEEIIEIYKDKSIQGEYGGSITWGSY